MAYYLYDANGYVADGPSTGGLAALSDWARSRPVVRDFVRAGFTRDPGGLADALSREMARSIGTSAGVASSVRALAEAARGASEVLILSDGVTRDDPTIPGGSNAA